MASVPGLLALIVPWGFSVAELCSLPVEYGLVERFYPIAAWQALCCSPAWKESPVDDNPRKINLCTLSVQETLLNI